MRERLELLPEVVGDGDLLVLGRRLEVELAEAEDEQVPVTPEIEAELEAFAQAQGARDFQAWVGTENYEMRVDPELAWIDQQVLDIVRGVSGGRG